MRAGVREHFARVCKVCGLPRAVKVDGDGRKAERGNGIFGEVEGGFSKQGGGR